MMIHFYKYHGAGNDFVIIDDRNLQFSVGDVQLIHHICDRHIGIGSDGLILLQNHNELDFRMVYFNADGKVSSMCGNGGRCITAFAKKLGLIESQAKFEAIDGNHESIIEEDDSIILKMNDISKIVKIEDAWIMDTGSPHIVFQTDDIDGLDLIEEAHKVRYNEVYRRDGINVNYLQDVDGQLKMRTYERGVENETQSCGTGTVAVAIVAGLLSPSKELKQWKEIDAPGGRLAVKIDDLNAEFARGIWLKGPAQFVFEGSFTL